MSKTRESPKIAKIMVFRYFFKQKLHFLAMMCVKVCLHMFLLRINWINKIKQSGSVSLKTNKTKKKKKKKKNRFVCNFKGKSVFRCTQRAITPRCVITLGPIFIKMILNWAQGLKKKVKKFRREKHKNQQIYNKKCRRGGADPAPGSFRVKYTIRDKSLKFVTKIFCHIFLIFICFLISFWHVQQALYR